MPIDKPRTGWHHRAMEPRYRTLAGACLTQFTVIGLFFAYGVFFTELEREFGWSRTLLSGCTSLAVFVMGTFAILGGRLNDALGPRIVLTVTGLGYGLGFALLAFIQAPWQLYLIFATFLGLGMATHDVVTLSTVARWFERRRGIMTGVVKLGTAAGQAALPPIAAALILAFGWRTSFLILGIAAAVLLLAAALSMQAPPRHADHGTAAHGVTYAEARRTRTFWTLCAMQFLFFPTLMTVPLHMAPHGRDLGLTETTAALLLTVMGLSSAAGRLAVGFLADRIGGKNAYTAALAVLVASLLGLSFVSAPAALFAVVAVYGAAHGAHFVVVSPTVASYFGMRAHGAIFGTVLFFGTIGGAIGPILAGLAFDQWGSYLPAFLTLTAAATLALVLSLTLPRAEDRA